MTPSTSSPITIAILDDFKTMRQAYQAAKQLFGDNFTLTAEGTFSKSNTLKETTFGIPQPILKVGSKWFYCEINKEPTKLQTYLHLPSRFILTTTHYRHTPLAFHARIAPGDQYYNADDTPTLILAHSAKSAAAKFAEHWDLNANYTLANNSNEMIQVLITSAYQDEPETFIINCDWDISYHAINLAVTQRADVQQPASQDPLAQPNEEPSP